MCGIAGFLSKPSAGDFDDSIKAMTGALSSRGPDASASWIDRDQGVALGHTRLSILDLSAMGSQPMLSDDNRYVIVFNGEIYNHLELRHAVKKTDWDGRSDTETLLAAIKDWGIEKTLKEIVGMFAFAVFDRKNNELTLARDRFGEKPLYFGWQGECLLFGSELKALAQHPSFLGLVNSGALEAFLTFGYVPTPLSIWSGIQKLEPGCYVTIPLGNIYHIPPRQVYWNSVEIFDSSPKLYQSLGASVDKLHEMLSKSVQEKLVADVPVGAFLSGGIDSSSIVAIMQSISDSQVQTFTVGFLESGYDESRHAAKIAAYLGTCHHDIQVSASDLIDLVPLIPQAFDEPFGDSSQIPTFLLSKLASQHVKVVLSGDGADELFGGYNRYTWMPTLIRFFGSLPDTARLSFARLLLKVSPLHWDVFSKSLPKGLRQPAFGDKIHKLGGLLSIDNLEEAYKFVSSNALDPSGLFKNDFLRQKTSSVSWATELLRDKGTASTAHGMMIADVVSYMTDDILCKVDRSGMANSLETRMPFLDHRLADYAFCLPQQHKISGLQGKIVLKTMLERFVPSSLTARPKQGFALPIDSWLRGCLAEWSFELLNDTSLVSQNWLKPDLITQKWDEHFSGRKNHQHFLWNILMLQSWCKKWQGFIRGIA